MQSRHSRRATFAAAVVLIVVTSAVGLTACGNGMSTGGSGGSDAASSAPTSTDPTVAVVGLTVAQAEEWARNHGYTVRVVEEDGTSNPGTMDFRTDRINVTVTAGVITAAKIG